jgi:hypothetical protein
LQHGTRSQYRITEIWHELQRYRIATLDSPWFEIVPSSDGIPVPGD